MIVHVRNSSKGQWKKKIWVFHKILTFVVLLSKVLVSQHGHMNQFMHKQKNSMLTNEFYPWRESKRTPFRHNNSETYSQTVWKWQSKQNHSFNQKMLKNSFFFRFWLSFVIVVDKNCRNEAILMFFLKNDIITLILVLICQWFVSLLKNYLWILKLSTLYANSVKWFIAGI